MTSIFFKGVVQPPTSLVVNWCHPVGEFGTRIYLARSVGGQKSLSLEHQGVGLINAVRLLEEWLVGLYRVLPSYIAIICDYNIPL